MLGDPLPPKQPAKVLRAKQLRTIQTVLAVFFGLSVLGWWCHRAMEARRWWGEYPYRCEACKALVDSTVISLAKGQVDSSYEFCAAEAFERFFGRLKFSHHVTPDVRADMLRACTQLMGTAALYDSLTGAVRQSEIPRLLRELQARQVAQDRGVPLAASLLRAGGEGKHHESVDDAIRAESASLYERVCMVGATVAVAGQGPALACTTARQLQTTDLHAFIDVQRAANAELDPRQHPTVDGHDGRFVDPKDWPELHGKKKGRELSDSGRQRGGARWHFAHLDGIEEGDLDDGF
jgi:hypothetical protein